MLRTFVGSVMLCTLGACTVIPQADLKTYRDAFAQSNTAAQEVLLDYSQAAEETTKRRAQASAGAAVASAVDAAREPFPATFTSPGTDARVDPVTVRIKAMEAIGRFNDLLATLAEGKSVAQVQGSVNQLLGVVGNLVAITPGVGPLVNNLAGALEKARTQVEFKRAVQEGQPVIGKILMVLEGEAGDYYEVRKALTLSDLTVIKGRITGRVGVIVNKVERSPAGALSWTVTEQALSAELAKIGGLGGRTSIPLVAKCKSGAGLQCAALAPDDISDTLTALRQDVAAYQQGGEKLRIYHHLLMNYVRLLEATRLAAAALKREVEKPADIAAQFDDIFSTVLALRKDWIKFRSN